ncbi:hypothetical protein GIB67_031192 [Kingdonia uniflora]|uniref:Uncharacterized protein n=1 Tax=Kingdonia uniflora TaxID=39325 RepID=A0A7J7NK47_9MAGN|nr:hypothetical protein GIB67_031192 [Kingdonia uniflora]
MGMGGLMLNLAWMSEYSKKQCRSVFWRTRAAIKDMKSGNNKQRLNSFQYDPSSYALNFDDGVHSLKQEEVAYTVVPELYSQTETSTTTTTTTTSSSTWVYILLVKSV